MTTVALDLDKGNGPALRRGTRALRWTLRVVMVAMVVAMVLGERPPAIVSVLYAALVVGILAVIEPLYRTDERVGVLAPGGSIVFDDAGVHLHHDSVLADDALIPWASVSAIVVDTDRGRGFPYEVEGRTRFLLDNAAAGLDPRRRPPLLATVPVRPNVLLLIDPPADLPWSHPDRNALSFIGFRGPGAPARPWSDPAPTPAVWMRIVKPAAVEQHIQARSRLRRLAKTDVHRLRYELGDLPGPNPFRAST
jgi:hypothetical protein